ncbi:S24 family peptidase, partial [Latilactobacillus sakei subsp. carnosus]|uniref:LexA family transcriptional regulator n=1 Tax=Latilactobacillus sakei TaxID=1599 RepID=UPI00363629BD
MNTKEVLDRLKQANKVSTNKELAGALDVSPSNISTWIQRSSIPYKEICETSISTGFSVAWLLTGEGDQRDKASDYVNVPEYKIEASAGHGALVEDETPSQYIAIKKANLAAAGVNTSNLMIIYARGDSMEPTFNSGDPLFIDRTFHTVAPEGGIYVFNYNGELFVKRLQLAFTGDLLVISDNDKYP